MKTKGTKEWAVKNVNFCKGCSNDCIYCYAKNIAYRCGWKEKGSWKDMELKPEMAYKKFKKIDGWIMSPSSHDITTDNIDLAIKVFKNILESGNDLLIVSKPEKELIDLLINSLWKYKKQILFRFTIGSHDDDTLRFFEPNAPNYQSRIGSLQLAYEYGFETSISIEPLLTRNVLKIINDIDVLVTDNIWIGPMNYQGKLFTEHPTAKNFAWLWQKETLLEIYQELIDLVDDRIAFKDTFLKIVEDNKP